MEKNQIAGESVVTERMTGQMFGHTSSQNANKSMHITKYSMKLLIQYTMSILILYRLKN